MTAFFLGGLIAISALFQTALDNQAPDAFVAEPDGLRHMASGYACPMSLPDAVLVGSRRGSPGDPSAQGTYCEYQEAGKPVAYLAIFREAGPDLTDDFCQSLPQTLDLQIGPRLPGIRQYEEVGPWPDRLPTPTVGGQPVAPRTCALTRPPRVIVYSAAAFTRDGWTVRAIATPIPPPGCAGYPGVRRVLKDLLGLVLIANTTQSFKPPSA